MTWPNFEEPTKEQLEAMDGLRAEIKRRIKMEKDAGTEMFMGWPDRWYEPPGPRWRCINDHVSTRYLKAEARGDLCLACHEFVFFTFPEDVDGPLERVEPEERSDG